MMNTPYINTIFFLIMVFSNILANLLPLGGNTTGEVSALYPNLFTPAPYTFSIWGVIYLLMGIFIVIQFAKNHNYCSDDKIEQTVGIWFGISCMANTLWILCWHYRLLFLSLICMFVLLLSLIMINLRLAKLVTCSNVDRICIYGFQIYLGWICAATIANVSAFLVKTGLVISGFPAQLITSIILLIGAGIALCLIMFGQRFFSALGIVWAYLGILVKHLSPGGYNRAYPLVIATCLLSIIGIILVMRSYLVNNIPD